MQTKLLRVLQTQEIERVGGSNPIKLDFRLICATHRSLEEMVAQGKFRQDLYFRINTVPIRLPSLCERLDEIPHLVATFIEKSRNKIGHERIGITPEAIALLRSYNWPGNIRELEHCIERACLVPGDSMLRPADFWWFKPNPIPIPKPATDAVAAPAMAAFSPAPMAAPTPEVAAAAASNHGLSPLESAECDALRQTLQAHYWNFTRSANSLGISRSTLYAKANKYGLKRQN